MVAVLARALLRGWPLRTVGLHHAGIRTYATVSLERSSAFARVDDTDLSVFESILGSSAVLTDPSDVEPYNTYVKLARRMKRSACRIDCASGVHLAAYSEICASYFST